jgi:hypothetical protein
MSHGLEFEITGDAKEHPLANKAGEWILNNKFASVGAVLTSGFLLGLHFTSIFAGVGRDTGAFLFVADYLLEGHVPYKDVVDHKPPGIYFFLVPIVALFDTPYHAIMVAKSILLVVNFATAAILVEIARRIWSVKTGFLAATLYLSSLFFYQGTLVLTEQFVAFWSVLALLALLEHQRAPDVRYIVLAGLASGTAVLFKQPGITTVGSLGLYLLITERNHLERIGAYVAAVALPIVLSVLFFALKGGHSEYVYWALIVNFLEYGHASSTESLYHSVMKRVEMFPLIWITPFVSAVLTEIRGLVDGRARLVGLLYVTALLPLWFRQYPHYFIQALPFAALLSAVFVYLISDSLSEASRSWEIRALLAIMLIASSGTAFAVVDEAQNPNHDSVQQQQIAADIQELTAPGDRILVLNAEPLYYYLSDRDPVGLPNIYYLTVNDGVTWTEQEKHQLIESGDAKVILIRTWAMSEETIKVIEERYNLVEEYYGFALYRLVVTMTAPSTVESCTFIE